MRNIIIVVLLAAAAGTAAQPVWRCGNSYGPHPCEGGSRLGAPSPVTSGEAARARAVGQADARLAQTLETERLAREKQAPKAVIPPQPVASASVKAVDKKPAGKKPGGKKQPDWLTAVEPGKAPAKGKKQDK